jgi:hypothetical protein
MKIMLYVCAKIILGLGVIMVALPGCGQPTIDASSDESMKQSVQRVREALPESKQEEFNEAMQTVAFYRIDVGILYAENMVGAGTLEWRIRKSLDGKTAAQVITEAALIREEQEGQALKVLAEEKEQERRLCAERAEREKQELQYLEEEKRKKERRAAEKFEAQLAEYKKTEEIRVQLKKFEVLQSLFYMKECGVIGKRPTVDLTVRNGLSRAVSRVYFWGAVISPGRSIPWYEGAFNCDIPGGIEPGEEATWSLRPSIYSAFGKANAPADAMLSVVVERVDGVGGRPIYSTMGPSNVAQEMLDKLERRSNLEALLDAKKEQ